MQIVIDIPEEKFEYMVKHLGVMSSYNYDELFDAVIHGTPLPKGHGRLIDADVIDNNIYDLTRSMDLNYGQASEVIDNAPTIIEADKAESEDKE